MKSLLGIHSSASMATRAQMHPMRLTYQIRIMIKAMILKNDLVSWLLLNLATTAKILKIL